MNSEKLLSIDANDKKYIDLFKDYLKSKGWKIGKGREGDTFNATMKNDYMIFMVDGYKITPIGTHAKGALIMFVCWFQTTEHSKNIIFPKKYCGVHGDEPRRVSK